MKKKKVLVIDDNQENLEAAKEQLGEDYNLTAISTFEEAKKMLSEEKWDIVMTDIFMPATEDGLTSEGLRHSHELVPVGLILALVALKENTPQIFIVSDTNRHSHPIAWAMDNIRSGYDEASEDRIVCRYHFSDASGKRVKDWKRVLKAKQ